MSTNLRGYGHIERVKEDAAALRDILERQGQSFVNDCVAEFIGDNAAKYKLTYVEAAAIGNRVMEDLREAINERI